MTLLVTTGVLHIVVLCPVHITGCSLARDSKISYPRKQEEQR